MWKTPIIPDDEQVEESPPLTPTLVNNTQTLDCPLVHPGGIPSAELQAATREDETLQAWRAKADESLDGFYWDDGLLMKTITTNLEEQRELLIMPHEFHPRLLKTAHDRQGHLGVKKVKAPLLRRVLWPMLHQDVVQWCLSCDTCQRNRKNKAPKAPMMEVPVLAVPFEKVAIDLVGPFERAKSGHRFVVTCIDLASRYPEATPLRAATAEDVAEALLEIFSRHGLPRTILSDQGHNLTGKVMTQLCERLHIEKIQTSPYHPESNGCVERLHGTLVPMLKKAADSKFQWPLQLKFCLFAIRSTPNRSTGFSPYEVVYGTTMRTPVGLMVDEWMEPKEYSMDVGKWMAELEERLETIRMQVTDNGLLARAQSKHYFDAKARTREFPPESMVLLRTPGLTGKMKESWTGPFEVLRRVTAVNVELGLPGRSKKKCRVVHVNTIKPCHLPDCRVLRVMVVAEDPDELPLKPVLAGDQLMEAQTTQLQQILEGAEGTFRDDPGLTTGCEHLIKTGDALPIRSGPYVISPKKLEGVRKEIFSLLEKGIIVPSTASGPRPSCLSSSRTDLFDFVWISASLMPSHSLTPTVCPLLRN